MQLMSIARSLTVMGSFVNTHKENQASHQTSTTVFPMCRNRLILLWIPQKVLNPALPRTLPHHYKNSALLLPPSLPHKHFSLRFATCQSFALCLGSTIHPMLNHYRSSIPSSKTFFSHLTS